VLRGIWEGKRDREIATVLGLSPRTVGNHACNIFRKLNVETRTAVVRHCALALSAVLLAQ
jgi:DNA-binding NarL/FixJ family response regulator